MKPQQVIFDRNDALTAYNFEVGFKFYLGYANNPAKQVSILFPDLLWLKAKFGQTLENMNEGRENEINDLQKCLDHNVPMWEYPNLQYYKEDNGKYFRESTKSGDFEMRDGKYQQRLVEYIPYKLGEDGRKQFEANIAQGLYILCELV